MTTHLLTTQEAARFLRVGHSTLARYRMEGTGPPYCQIGRSVLYRKADLDRYIKDNLRYSTAARAHPLTGELPGDDG